MYISDLVFLGGTVPMGDETSRMLLLSGVGLPDNKQLYESDFRLHDTIICQDIFMLT